MRDLKVLTLVKAKRIDNGEWVKGELITNGLGKDKHKMLFILPEDANEFNFDLALQVIPETVCRYWMTHKKCGELFEGDKVIAKGAKRIGEYETEIIFDGTMFTLKKNHTMFIDSACSVTILKNIGNIND
jgi:hypothetical protein